MSTYTSYMSQKSIITLAIDNDGAKQYLQDSLEYRGIKYVYDSNKLRAKFELECEADAARAIAAEIILYFFKFEEIYKQLKKCAIKNMCFYAYIGSILSIDFEQEKARLIKDMQKMGSTISVDGFYNFCSEQMRNNWKSLSQLAYKLYNQCESEEDVFELTSFMLSVDGEGCSIIVIESCRPVKIMKNRVRVPLLNIFNKVEFNVIATILSHRPTNIIVLRPDEMEPALMDAIHSLGE